MSAPWKSVLVVAVLCAAVGPAADPPKPVHLPLTPFEVLALVHTEASDDAVIRKLKESGTRFAPGAPELRQLRQLGVSDKVLVAVTTEPPAQAIPVKMSRPVGTWVREVGPMRIVMKFTEDRVTVTANVPGPEGEGDVVLTADADYSVNPEGLMFGVISGIDADVPDAATELQMLTGHTFSARCRVDGATMTVKDLKAFGSGLNKGEAMDDFAAAMQMACGRYTRDDNAKPVAPRKAKPRAGKASFGAGPFIQPSFQSPVPHAQPLIAHHPYGIVELAPSMPQPVPSFNAPMMPPPPLPGNVYQAGWTVYPHPQARLADPVPPPPMTTLSATPSNVAPAGAPLSSNPGHTFNYHLVPQPTPVRNVNPVGSVIIELDPAYGRNGKVVAAPVTCDAVKPLNLAEAPQSPSSMSIPAAGNRDVKGLVGAWIREVDGVQVVAKFTEKRAFFTANSAFLEEKQEHRMTLRVEADYAVGPDGTVFGVITGTDCTPPKGDAARDMTSELRQLAELNGSPFCFRFRLDEGNLNLRDLRCGESSPRNSDSLMGRFKPLGDQQPTPPKPVKMKANEACPNCPPLERIGIDFDINLGGKGGMTPPSPHYLKHYPQYFPPDPAFPLQRELDSMIRVPEIAPAPRPAPRR